jgi:uncharacterized membrane protein YbaN (DUF454 family)
MSGTAKNNLIIQQDEFKLIKNPFIRWILFVSGFILVGLGVAGMFLPLLPTTIFLILAAWCFARSSERFYRWIHYNSLFGKYIRDYRSGNGMTFRSKIISVTVLWTGIIASAYWGTDSIYVRLILLIVAIGVTWHLAVIKTVSEYEKEK